MTDLVLYRRVLEKEKVSAKESIADFYTFFRNFWHIISTEEFVDNWHIHYICGELQKLGIKVANGEDIQDHIINIPPGTTKTSMATVVWPVWMWLIKPTCRTVKVSYAGNISTDANIKSKQIVQSDWFQRWFQPYFLAKYGHELKLIKDNQKDFRNNFGGVQYATSTTGTITGLHYHIEIQDDPISQEQSESQAYRERANRFQDRTLTNRKIHKDKTPLVTIMQRLHEDDPTGHILKNEKSDVRHICIPAELSDNVKPKELRDKYEGGLMDPHRLGRKILDRLYIKMGAYGYAGQYQQTPSPEGGGKIKKSWFQFIHLKEVSPHLHWEMWIDGAYTKSSENDPTGFMICAFEPNEYKLYIGHAFSDFLEMPELLETTPRYAENNNMRNDARIYIEPKASGKSLAQLLVSETKMNPVEIESQLIKEGKNARLQAAAPRVQAGRVVLLEGGWNDDFIGQLTGFPTATHDEYVDLLGYACDYYFSLEFEAEDEEDVEVYDDRVHISQF